MPDFETFTRALVPLGREPLVTIQKRGVMSINQAAFRTLGRPGAVELLYDAHKHIVGLHPVDPRAENAYCLRSSAAGRTGPFVISAMAFLHFYSIDTTVSRRWPAYLEDDILCVNLEDAATPVTSNRARRSAEAVQ